MRIGILGTRGIPNHYGGFEQFAEFLSVGLVQRGHQVWVYNSHNHPYQTSIYKGVSIIHCQDPEDKISTIGQFVYDLNCIRDARQRNFEIILQLGYTSSSVWGWLMPKNVIVVTNMDGLEWKRSKYNKPVRKFLKVAESLAIKTSHHLVSDSIGIRTYLFDEYKKDSTYIAYGATVIEEEDRNVPGKWGVEPFKYDLLIARMEPENNIKMILDGVVSSNSTFPILVIGKTENAFGTEIKEVYSKDPRVIFTGSNYNKKELDQLRQFSRLYFHGHSVGGTNPSLLEAMGAKALIAAHDNIFNRAILGDESFYFSTVEEVVKLRNQIFRPDDQMETKVELNAIKIERFYNWDLIIDKYESLFSRILHGQNGTYKKRNIKRPAN